MSEEKPLTLAACEHEHDPECFHCDKPLPKSSLIDVQPNVIIVHCPDCGCMSLFQRTTPEDPA